MFVRVVFSLVCVAELSPFGEELLTRLTICFLCFLTISNFSYFLFWFEGLIWALIALVPGRCILVTSKPLEPRCEKTGLQGFLPGPTQTGLFSHRRWLEA